MEQNDAKRGKQSKAVMQYMTAIIRVVTKKKPDCINHAVGTMPIGKPLAHRETQLLSSVVLQFL